ncbi:hypothetical protein SEA_DEJAVU_111 [Microbacterium Phage DejaVu]|nr:hypothetical protein SEA_DEJAVU_111 [Microbacterium Phage DejaVu]
MNGDYCKDTFGRNIKADARVKITIKGSGVTLEGRTTSGVYENSEYANFRIDCLSATNTFYARDITVEEIFPPVKDGYYINRVGVVLKFAPTEEYAIAMYSQRGSETKHASPKQSYASMIANGELARVADINGKPVAS